MLDYNDIIERVDYYIERLNTRGTKHEYLKELVTLVKKRNKLIFTNDNFKNERNNKSKEIATLIKVNPKDQKINIYKSRITNIKTLILENSNHINDLNAKICEIVINTENVPYANCPIGASEKNNVEIRKWGQIKNKNKKPHWEIAEELKLVCFDKIVQNSGARFVSYVNRGAIIRRALINFMLDLHHANGYIEQSLPVLVKPNCMFGTGQFPKFSNDAYIVDNEELVLIPTAEVSVTNIHRDEIINVDLPISYCSFSLCFRKEAGAAGRDTRGLIRLHQFSKVELVKFTSQESSYEQLEILLSNAELILQKLDLPYRIIELCTGDLGFSAAKTYDIEVWMPHKQKYVEISSCSNFEDFQARRMNIRYKSKDDNQTRFVHTLNGSGLAVDRLFASLIENYWDENTKNIIIPNILKPYIRI